MIGRFWCYIQKRDPCQVFFPFCSELLWSIRQKDWIKQASGKEREVENCNLIWVIFGLKNESEIFFVRSFVRHFVLCKRLWWFNADGMDNNDWFKFNVTMTMKLPNSTFPLKLASRSITCYWTVKKVCWMQQQQQPVEMCAMETRRINRLFDRSFYNRLCWV